MTGNSSGWTTISDIRKILEKKWIKGIILREALHPQGIFPLRLSLTGPAPVELSSMFAEARKWIAEFTALGRSEIIKVEWKEVNNRIIGQNRIPVAVIFESPEQAARMLDKIYEYSLFKKVSGDLLSVFPVLKDWILKNIFRIINIADDLPRLIAVTQWIIKNPVPRIYTRQLSLKGVNTKFIESNKKEIGDWLDILLCQADINSAFTGTGNFEQRFGFKSKPQIIRFRILDEKIIIRGFSDIAVTADEFCRNTPDAENIFIIENDINCLAFPPVKNGMVVFGRGYGFSFLSNAHWLMDRKIRYWGDIDTHGFAILSQFRGFFPQTESFLMNEDILLKCRNSWTTETEQSSATPANLNKQEMNLFLDLKNNRFGKSVRLEQEFIPFDLVLDALTEIDAE
ncbi:MAG: hypothetical protein JW864_02050 [Spirochaetes bacterium]|nr:hypothetical protein [Spirochaetota bacterium]